MNKIALKLIIILFGFFDCSVVLAKIYHGEFQELVADNFKIKKTTYIYQLKTKQQLYTLKINPTLIKNTHVKFGDEINVEGSENKNQQLIEVKHLTVTHHHKLANNIVGKHNVLTVMLNFTDLKATDSTSSASLQQQLYTNPISVKSTYNASSANQFTFSTAADNTGNPGIYTVSLPYAAGNTCNYSPWANDAINTLKAQGVNVNSYQHWLFIIPQNAKCDFGGLAFLSCPTVCEAWVLAYNSVDISVIMSHELGHNLGLDHSNTNLFNSGNIIEYGDESDFMSAALSTRLLNGAHRDSLQWYQAFPFKIMNVTQSGQYIINSLDQDMNVLQVLKINKKNNAGTYYISYRTGASPFGMISPYLNSVNIHYTVPGDGHTYFVNSFGVGQSFVDAANGINISILSNFMDCGVVLNVVLS